MKLLFLIFCILLVLPLYAADEIELPDDIRPFVLEGYYAIAYETGDLNNDGRSDGILVLHRESEDKQAERALLILVRTPDGLFKMAKRNNKVVFCEGCGGMMGDPFQQITIERNRFTISHYGGSSWRWSDETTFAYSRKDNTWQLVRVEITSYHASDPDNEEKTVHTPPRDFGKIDIADFDPDKYL
jgi:hypothetical protein